MPDSTPVGEEGLYAEQRERAVTRLTPRERRVELVAAASFLAAAVALAVLAPEGRDFDWAFAVVTVLAFAVACRVRFHVGAGVTVPTPLVLVPMLLLLPAQYVPLLVAAALLVSDLPDYLRGSTHPERSLLAVSDAWYTVAPALILVLADSTSPTLDDWPIYLAALVAQLVSDAVILGLREYFGIGVTPTVEEVAWPYAVDSLLSPLGFAAALASQAFGKYLFVLVLPLIALLEIFARERRSRLEQALELSKAYRGTAMLLGDVVESDDEYTGAHSRDVVSLSVAVADELGLGDSARRDVEFGALLHDVGKIRIPKEIINKPGKLDEAEWELMKTHTVEGEKMLNRVGGVLSSVGKIVRSSHEHWNGKGYPDSLAGEAIPIESRIVSTCDAFNAMTTTRPYRKAMTLEEAVEELTTHAGTQFDPQVVTALMKVIERDATARATIERLRD
jgi:HD-GYP domain-containing protein (c-di-GMP phosphodiesterase class II)